MKKEGLNLLCLLLMFSIFACISYRTAVSLQTVQEIEPAANNTVQPEYPDAQTGMGYTEEELTIESGELNIWGKLYLPEETQRFPLVICSHGFGGSYRNTEEYAAYFAENGIAAFAFDFTGTKKRIFRLLAGEAVTLK